MRTGRPRVPAVGLLALSLGFAVTVSDAAPSAAPGQVRRDGAAPAHPGDDLRMSAMGRLAHRLASGELKKKVQNTLAARLGDSVRADEEDGPAGGQAETSLAVDSTGQHVVVGINDTRGFSSNPISVSGFMYSDDGGATFVDGGQLPVTVATSTIGTTVFPQVFGDPEVKYLGGSTFLYFSIMVKKFGATGTAQTMSVHRSTDNGHTWQGPFEIGPATNPNGLSSAGNAVDAADKEFADVDPDTGRVLMSWTNFTTVSVNNPGGVEMSTTFSDNITTATPPTWSARRVVAHGSLDGQASIPRFAGRGSSNAYVAWRRFSGATGQNVGFAISTDNGVTFGAAKNVAPAIFFTMDQVLGNDRNNTSPSMAVDSSAGPHSGEIYITYSNNDNHDGADVVIQTSSNQGASFTAPLKINSRVGSDRAQWFPWVTVDSTTGRVYVFYYDQGIAADGDLTETTCQYSDDGGVTWTRPAPLSDRPFHAAYGNDTGQPNLGDYNQAVARGDELFAVWAGTPPLLGFTDGLPSASMTAPDLNFARQSGLPRLAVSLGPVSYTDTGSSSLSGNAFVDPGEQIALTIPLKNYVTNPSAGAGSVTGISATLTTATTGVLVLIGSSMYANMPAGGSAGNQTPYTLAISPGFTPGTHIDLTLTVSANEGSTVLRYLLATGSPLATSLVSENFNGVATGALPPGWTNQHVAGVNGAWTTSNQSLGASPATISNAAFHTNTGTSTSAVSQTERLVSPAFTVPANSEYVTVDFDVAYDTDDEPAFNVQAYDGLLLRIAGATRTVAVEAFAEQFTTGTAAFYPKHLPRSDDPSYFQDLSAWAGDSAGYKHVHLKLPGMAGSTAALDFEFTQDATFSCTGERPGHRCGVLIDNVVVQSVASMAPTNVSVTASTNPTVAGQPVVFTAAVTTAGGSFATDGTVTFREGATVLQGPTAVSNGRTTFTTSGLTLGSHTITASYTSSTGQFAAGTGSLVEQIVAPPTISIADASVTEPATGTTPAQFHVTLSHGSSAAVVSVSYTTADQTATAGSDYVATSGTVVFQPGEVDKVVTVLANADTIGEPSETFLVNLSSAVNATIADGQAVGTIADALVNPATVTQSVTAGVSRLQALQNPDGGWFFLVGTTNCGFGPGVSCRNTVGITALGLLTGYTRTGNLSYLTSAKAAGDYLVGLYNTAMLQTPPGLPFYQDVEFLVELAAATGNATYASTAQSWFNVVVARYPNAADKVDATFATRSGQGLRTVAAWDSASFIRAAKAVGNVTYASAAASRVVAREPDWKDTNPAHRFDQCPSQACGPADNPFAFDYTLAAEGSLLWSFHDLPGFEPQVSEYRSFLLAQQDPAGSWDAGDSQITVYIMYGLAAVGGAGTDAAMARAGGFYVANELADGGWPSAVAASGNGAEFTEVDGEVVRAMQTLFSTPAGSNVSVAPAQLSTLTFGTVTAAGVTSVVAAGPGTATILPAGFQVVERLNYEVTTTAAIAGDVTVCFTVPWITDAVSFASVRLLQSDNGVFVDRTLLAPDALAPDFTRRRVCGRTTSLQPFAIALREPDTTPPSIAVTLTPSAVKADGRLVTVTAAIDVSDDTDPAPSVQLLSITSNEPLDGHDIVDAAIGADDRTFRLRAEHGRPLVYTVVYRATDASGKMRDASATVTVARPGRRRPGS